MHLSKTPRFTNRARYALVSSGDAGGVHERQMQMVLCTPVAASSCSTGTPTTLIGLEHASPSSFCNTRRPASPCRIRKRERRHTGSPHRRTSIYFHDEYGSKGVARKHFSSKCPLCVASEDGNAKNQDENVVVVVIITTTTTTVTTTVIIM